MTNRNSGSGCFRTLMLFLMGVFFVALASGISLLWIYTGGKLDQRSIEKAIPVIQRDAEVTLGHVGKKVESGYQASKPYIDHVKVKTNDLWEEIGRRHKVAAHWVHVNLGPTMCHALTVAKGYLQWCQMQVIIPNL